MGILRKDLLLYILVILFCGNLADKSSFYDDTLTQNTDFSQNENSIDFRLPTDIKPFSYEIKLIPNLQDNFTFTGYVTIEAVVEQPTDNITLHVGNLNIERVTVISFENEDLSTSYDKITEKFTITLPTILTKGKNLSIYIEYTGILSDNMIGFYRSSYLDEDEETKWLAATQFQTAHARHAFPCFDEPRFKAKFTIRIARDNSYKVISNMPLNQTIKLESGEKIWDIFNESISMPTYLVAFVISEFESTADTSGRTNISVWSKPSTIKQADYALNISIALLNLYEEKFNETYALEKLDMVAIPDFAAGAMENWGLVTYRESRMLYDPKESSALAQQSVASVIAHELAHMWFGNLVTPEWWSYLWLSEAFARYFQYFGTAEIEKNWNMAEQFVVEQHQSALIVDSFESSLPMTREVSNKLQLAGIADTITYNKGASIVRMMNLIFGADTFENALRSYIKNNKIEGLGQPNDLWIAIIDEMDRQGIIHIDIKEAMNRWTTQPGYPVISIVRSFSGQLTITQERFFLRNLDKTPKNIVWSVPLTYTTQSKSNFNEIKPKYWLTTEKTSANLKINPKEWIIFNIQSSGFYRVNYDNDGWHMIINALKNGNDLNEIHVLNRAGIVDDLLNLGRAGYQNYNIILDGLLYLKRETNYLPFKAAFNGFEYLNRRFTGQPNYFLFKTYILSLIENVHLNLGYKDNKDEDRLTVLLRHEVNNLLCSLDDDECIMTYIDKFKQWKINESARIEPNERATAYCVAIKHGTSEDWEYLWNEYFYSNYPTDQTVIIKALGCSQNITILEQYLKYAIDDYSKNRIRKQDSTSVFAAVYNSGLLGAECVLDFVEKYYKDMENYYGDQSTIAGILDGTSQRLSTNELVNKFEKLINDHKADFASIQKSLESSLRIAKYELTWYSTYSPPIIEWLQKYDEKSYRLPPHISPQKYVISVKPYLEPGNFIVDGNVTIKAVVMQSTSQIILHSSEIKHHSVEVIVDHQFVEILKMTYIPHYDLFKIYLKEELLNQTTVIIKISYTSSLNATELRGFYKSSYVNEEGETRWLAASHLEPVGARKMFPCFDEPAMKAIFTVKVNVLPNYQPISNMDWQKIEKIDGYRLYTFFKSVPMSTYLVALVVSDFEYKSEQINGIELAVYARPNAINQTDYALSVMHPLLNFFETTYNQKYQLSKLYMAALPDFGSGAMENWGLLTYRETSMLYDENNSPITNKQDIRNVIAHEISHQWFGNLVSPLWWKYLWLNEGFARYFEYHAPARVFNDMTLESQFVVDQVHSAFSVDSFKSTHPMSQDVDSVSEIRSIFDTITYNKGGSILRMIEKTYGTDVFDNALSDYLDKRKYGVATPEDLYASLKLKIEEKGLKDDINVILDTWTTQSGYPIVNVYVTKPTISITQKRFFLKAHENNFDNTTWHIPITWTLVENNSGYFNTTPKLWLKDQMEKIGNPSPESLLIFNIQQSGYYRVNYDENYWIQLIDFLRSQNFAVIHEINRAGLIDDLMNLARADYVSYKITITATMYLENENNYFPWRAFFNNLPYLNKRFTGRDIESLYKKWLAFLIEGLYKKLGFNDNVNETDLTKVLRIHARKWACQLDVGDCRYQAALYFREKQHSKTIPPNYRDVVYCTAMRIDKTNQTYEFLWEEYLNSNVDTDKLVILRSLACSENEDILEKLLQDAVTENSPIRYQNSANVFSNVYDASLIGVEVVMKVIEKYYDDILQRHFNDYTKIANIVSALASRLSTKELYNQYEKLLNELVNKEPEFKNFVDSYLATAQYEFDWYEKHAPVIFETLDNLFSSDAYRLPKTLNPKLYNIHLTPHMEEGTFEGQVKIQMTARQDTTLITLNSHKLNILQINVITNDRKIRVQNYTTHIAQQLKIYLSDYIHTNEEILVSIDYNGVLNDDMNGFYRSSYFDTNNEQHWLATTQFEPTHARQAFPCFDEPAFKSKFQITIKRPKRYHSLSNMVLSETKKDGEYETDVFYTSSVDMSTYLVAFVVSEFESAYNPKNGTFDVWGRPEIAVHGKFAQDIGMRMIKELESITDIDYPLLKLDLIGIPDFSMGAMENWGLATFREYGLFYDKNETTSTYEKYIITVIAHELAHMWFGNLVTCEWWEYIWLNEGFAQYFEWFASNRILPKYKFMDQFVVYELQSALSKDASTSAHPMTNPVQTPEEIANVFDYVTYGKSASVLRMLFNAFDQETYMAALHDYLTKRKYNTARPADLWESFDSFVSITIDNKNVSVEDIMNTWTNQPGYPVVNAALKGNLLTLSQERFIMTKYDTGNEFYWIPIDIFTSSDAIKPTSNESRIWLGSKPTTIYINPNNNWYIVNYKQTGFYRVNYDIASWQTLISKLNSETFETIDVLNRAQIIDDLFNLARADYVEYELVMNASRYLKQESNHLPWRAFLNGLSYIYNRFEQQNFQQNLNKYFLDLLSKIYNKVGFFDQDNEEHLDKLNREMILQWACKLNKSECVSTSITMFKDWRHGTVSRIPRDARPAIYCTAIKNAIQKESSENWHFLMTQYLQTNFASEKKIIINALGCSTDENVLRNYLEKAIETQKPVFIRRQDVAAVFTSVYSASSVGVNVTLDFIIRNTERLYKYFGNWDGIADLIVNLAPYISTKDQRDTMMDYIEQNMALFPYSIRIKLNSALTTANNNLVWFQDNGNKISQWILSAQEKPEEEVEPDSSTRIESLNIVLTSLIALMSYLWSYF